MTIEDSIRHHEVTLELLDTINHISIYEFLYSVSKSNDKGSRIPKYSIHYIRDYITIKKRKLHKLSCINSISDFCNKRGSKG